MGLIRNAAAWAADYAYAGWWQVRAFVTRTNPAKFREGDAVPILIIPGVYEPWQFLMPLIRDLHRHGHPVFVVDPLRDNRMPVPEGAQIVDEYLAQEQPDEVVIVAHSKGGLIGKYVMSFGENARRIRAMVAVAAPFGGSRYARFLLNPTLRSFSPHDATVMRLAGELEANTRIVSVFARFDPHIPEGSELAGAKNVRVDAGGHFRILAHEETLREVYAAASRPTLGDDGEMWP